MSVDSLTFDVLVVGAGPAGMAAAARAAECGERVGIVDENAEAGGQIWRAALSGEGEKRDDAAAWKERLRSANVTKLYGMRVFDQPETGVVLAEKSYSSTDSFDSRQSQIAHPFDSLRSLRAGSVAESAGGVGQPRVCELRYKTLILATGARERFLPFPGWTLPNVMGAGALQAMVKSGLPIRGKHIVIAGTGPLLLAVAAYLKKQGGEIPIICEQASRARLARFGVGLLRHRQKITQALQLRKELRGVPYAANSWPVAAHGEERVKSVTIARDGKTEVFECDYLACGFHLIPNVELATLLGCKLAAGYVQVDEYQRASVKDVFCAGEPTALGGVELALAEGQIAGLAAAGDTMKARKLFAARRKARSFARLLDRTFKPRPELRDLPAPETIVCRCEDVQYSRLKIHHSWRAAKLQTRCGMGPCQGRVCGPATEFLLGWNLDSVRPPIFPAKVGSLGFKAVSGG